MTRAQDPIARLREAEADRDARKRKAGRRRSARRALRFNLALLAAFVGLGLLAIRAEKIAPLLEEHGDLLGRAAESLRRADVDAASSEEIFTLRRRVEDRFRDCVGVTAASRPVRLQRMPGMLAVQAEGAPGPALELSLGALKQGGPTGDWITRRAGRGLTDQQLRGLSALAVFAVYDPTGPCPNADAPVNR